MRITEFVKKENNNLDLVRILLSCLVIVGHSAAINGPSKFWVDPIIEYFPFTYSGGLAVKLFFFVSGMLVTNSILTNKSALHFIVSRVFRLMPAFLIVLVITAFIFGPAVTSYSVSDYLSNSGPLQYVKHNFLFAPDFTLPGVFTNNLYAEAVNGSIWSLKYEVACYVGLLGIFLILRNTTSRIYFNIVVVLILLDSMLPTRIIFGWLGESPEFYLLPFSFALGSFFAINADIISVDIKGVIGCFLLYYIFNHTPFAESFLIIAFSMAIIYLASNKFVLRVKPKYDISYGLYLWGFLIQQTIYYLIGHVYTGLHCLLALIISAIFALATYILIERPFIAFGRSFTALVRNRFPAL